MLYLLIHCSSRERHAKTLDIAQEEVLTCLGIYVYERLQKVWQRLRAEEQSWQLLFYICINTLKSAFEVGNFTGYIWPNIKLGSLGFHHVFISEVSPGWIHTSISSLW